MLHSVIAAAAAVETKNPLIPEIYDIIWSSLCFLVILFFFWRAVLPKMKVLLDERSAAIEGNIAKAGAAQAEAEGAGEGQRSRENSDEVGFHEFLFRSVRCADQTVGAQPGSYSRVQSFMASGSPMI